MSDLRVLRVIHDLQVGGVQRMMLRSLEELRQLGVDSEVCCIHGRGPLADEFERAGFPVNIVPFSARLDPFGLGMLRWLVRRRGFDVVHSHMYAANIAVNFAMIGNRSIPVVNSYHSTIPVRNARQARRVRWTRGVPAAFVAVGETVRDAVESIGVERERIEIIHNGIELPPAPPPVRARRPGDPIRLVWAGRFVRQKRLNFLVEVARRCADRGVPVRLTLLGDGPERRHLRELVRDRRLDSLVEMPGMVPDVRGHLRNADLYVSASEREGFSNALLEAGSAGRGLLLSDIGPHRELVGQSGCGRFPGESADEWAVEIARLADHSQELVRLGRRAFERAADFTVSMCGGRTLQLYRAVLSESRSGKSDPEIPRLRTAIAAA